MRDIDRVIPPSPDAPLSLSPGLKLDRYELLCPIAEGGMATVWIARRTGSKAGFEKLVAIKTILPKYAADVRFQRMFVAEARLASRIEHVNVAQILDVGEQQEMTYLVMEYVDGEALSKVHRALERTGALIPTGILLRIMADVCGGLHAAHELRDEHGVHLGVVHRDVSPQNVLVSRTGIVKLIDFGIAVARDRYGADTNTGQLKGKVRYMAPEHVLGHKVDRRTDIWAAGAVLHHLLSGKPPFEGENEMHTILLLKSAPEPPPLPSEVHPAVAAVTRRALSPAPDDRFSTAAEMQEALEGAMLEANLKTTTVAVAKFLEEVAAERARARKDAIAIGLRAAAERELVAEAMRARISKSDASSASGASGPRPLTQGATATESPAAIRSAAAAGAAPEPARRDRRSALVWGLVVGALLTMATIVVVATRPSSAGSTESTKTGDPAASSAPSASVVLPPAAASSATTGEGEPTPVAPAKAPLSTPAPVSAPVSPAPTVTVPPVYRPPAPQRPVAKPPRRPRVNDGF